MKKLSIFSALLVGAFLFAACDADRDDNPVLDLTKTQDPITMNTPTFAGGFYDLQNTDTIFFACTAPNYGFPATVTYALQVSIPSTCAYTPISMVWRVPTPTLTW